MIRLQVDLDDNAKGLAKLHRIAELDDCREAFDVLLDPVLVALQEIAHTVSTRTV